MGHHKSDEADDAAAGDDEGYHECGEEEEYSFDFLDFDAEALGGLAAGEQEVEVFGVIEYGGHAYEHHGCDDGDVEPGGAGEAAHSPEDDAVHLVLPQHHDEGDEGGDEEGEADAGEEESGGVEAVADGGYAINEPDGEQRGCEGADADAPHVALEAEEYGEGGSEGGARRDAEDVGVGERVAEDGLVGGSADGESGAGEQAEEYARQAELEEYLRVEQLGGGYPGDAEERACDHGCDKQQAQQRDNEPQSRLALYVSFVFHAFKRSLIVKNPCLPTRNSAARVAPRARPSRPLASWVRVMVSRGLS